MDADLQKINCWDKFCLIRLIPVLLWVTGGVQTDSEAWLTRAFNQDLALPELYNKHLRPQHKGPADTVHVGLKIYSIGPISESDMTMQIDMYFRTLWRDERLKSTFEFLVTDNSSNYYIDSQREKERKAEKNREASTSTSSSQDDGMMPSDLEPVSGNLTNQTDERSQKNEDIPQLITLGQEYAEAIWTPDIYFPDSVNIERPGKDLISDSMVLALYNDSRLFQSMRLQMKIRCKLALTLFPMDIQHCDICLESYQYHTGDVQLTWWKGKLEMDKTKMKKYGVANFHIDYDSFVNSTITEDFGFGFNYTTLCVQVRLVRKLSIFLITMYLPSISLVALSWVGFWIDKRAVPARASLTITTILAQITLITGTANQFPGIADLKVADLYLIINFFFVFASLIEFALVSYEPPVKTMAKSWLQSTREKLKQKPNTTPKANADSDANSRRKSLHNLLLESRKGQQKQTTGDSSIGEVLRNSAAKETPHPSPDHKSTNGYLTKDAKNEVPAKSEDFLRNCQNPANSSPLSLRQAILRRDKILELKELDSNESQSDMEHTPVLGTKHVQFSKKSPLKNHESLLYDLTKASKNGRTDSPSSTSPLLPPVTPLNNIHSSPRFTKKTKNNNNMLFNSPAYSEHEFVEIKDIGKDLVPKQKPVQREVMIISDKQHKFSPETTKSLNLHTKPLDTLIKLEKSPVTKTVAARVDEDEFEVSAISRKKKLLEKKEKKDDRNQESRICTCLKKYFPCLRPIVEYFQSDQFSKDNADSVSKWLFPATFLVWNILYFTITLTWAGRLSHWYF